MRSEHSEGEAVGSRLGSVTDIRSRFEAMPDGVEHHQDDDHYQWWAKNGVYRWSMQFVPGMIAQRLPTWAELAPRQVLIADEGCWHARGEELAAYLDHFGVTWDLIQVPEGEAAKDLDIVHHMARQLAKLGVGPLDLVVSVGGGAVADATRLVTALWYRGTLCAILAMSPLAAIDAGAGTKFFVDLLKDDGELLKNALGGYRPALVTMADPDLFTTVPEEHVRSCTAELFKMMIKDPRIIELLEADGVELQATRWSDRAALPILAAATDPMIRAIQGNPTDEYKMRPVDFGHFVGKVIELRASPPMPHGHSVAICMAVTIVVAAQRGYIEWPYAERLLDLMRRLDIPTWHELLVPEMFERAISGVVKQRGNRQNVPMPHKDDVCVFVQDLTVPELVEAADYLRVRDDRDGAARRLERS